MSETSTPETDAWESDIHVACEYVNPPECKLIVPSFIARSLEFRLNKALKERDEAIEELKVWRQLNVIIAKLKEEAK